MIRILTLVTVLSITLQTAFASESILERPAINFNFEEPQVSMTAGIRPYRSAGLRLEKEIIDDSTVIHNYGHGGSGITLSWGTAEFAINLAKKELEGPRRATVLGAGVIGLSTAILLAEKGIQVDLYSGKFHPEITSAVAGGLWMPSAIKLENLPPEVVYHFINRSFEMFEKSKEKGFAVVPMPYFRVDKKVLSSPKPYSLQDLANHGIIPNYKVHEKLPISGVDESGLEFETFLIDLPLYMPQLMKHAKKLGVRVHQKWFENFEDVLSHVANPSLLFNCTGYGSKILFGDDSMRPKRGQLVWVKRDRNNQALTNYMISSPAGYLFARSGEYILGGTYEDTDIPEPQDRDGIRILEDHKDFFGF